MRRLIRTLVLTLSFAGLVASASAAPAEAGAATGDEASKVKPRLRLCTGTRGNNYFKAGEAIQKTLGDVIDVEVVETKGSWENLQSIDRTPRRCDAAIAQDDAFALYQFEKPNSALAIERVVSLYPEYIHLICNRKADVDDIFDLNPKKHRIIINEFGSGTYITWTLFGKMNPRHAEIAADGLSIEEGLLKIVDGVKAQCMMFVSGVTGRSMKMANDQFGKQLMLAEISDKKLRKRVGRDKRRVYHQSTLDEDVYAKLLDDDLDTVAVDAVFFISPEWKARYEREYQALAAALLNLVPELLGK